MLIPKDLEDLDLKMAQIKRIKEVRGIGKACDGARTREDERHTARLEEIDAKKAWTVAAEEAIKAGKAEPKQPTKEAPAPAPKAKAKKKAAAKKSKAK